LSNTSAAVGLVNPYKINKETIPKANCDQSSNEATFSVSHAKDDMSIMRFADLICIEPDDLVANLLRDTVLPFRFKSDRCRHTLWAANVLGYRRAPGSARRWRYVRARPRTPRG